MIANFSNRFNTILLFISSSVLYRETSYAFAQRLDNAQYITYYNNA